MEAARPPRIVLVGGCASGKSSTASALRERGWDAVVSGQEHSEIAWLWRRMEPDLLVLLHVDLDTLRLRRGDEWPEAIYERQMARLSDARAHAGLTIDTGVHALDIVVLLVEDRLLDILDR